MAALGRLPDSGLQHPIPSQYSRPPPWRQCGYLCYQLRSQQRRLREADKEGKRYSALKISLLTRFSRLTGMVPPSLFDTAPTTYHPVTPDGGLVQITLGPPLIPEVQSIPAKTQPELAPGVRDPPALPMYTDA